MGRSAIILVGGEARRAGGQEKYFFRYRGTTFIERLVATLRDVVDDIIIVAKDAEQCKRFSKIRGVRTISDVRRGIGPIGGLHAGVHAAKGDELFVVACDMPCVSPAVIEFLFSGLKDCDAVIPMWNHDMVEPLHAVYRRDAVIHYLHDHDSLSLRTMIRTLNARYISVDEIRSIDPGLLSFTNINKIEDLDRINGNKSASG